MSWWAPYFAQWASVTTDPPPPEVAREQPGEAFEDFDGPLREIPKGRRAARRIYGAPGRGKLDKKWARANMHTAKLLPGNWNGGSQKLWCHNLAEPYIREALRRCEVLGVLDSIEKIGCFNFRHQRHDPGRPLSYHSFGVALDMNSDDNKAIRFPERDGPKPFTGGWWELYPNGLSDVVVEVFESLGFLWGGRWTRFCDPMHFQLVR